MPTRAKIHTDEERAEAEWFFAFSEPTRLRILRALAAGPQAAKALSAACGISASNISSHIEKLERAGLVMIERDGIYRRCSLAAAAKVTKGAIEFSHPSGRKAVVPLT